MVKTKPELPEKQWENKILKLDWHRHHHYYFLLFLWYVGKIQKQFVHRRERENKKREREIFNTYKRNNFLPNASHMLHLIFTAYQKICAVLMKLPNFILTYMFDQRKSSLVLPSILQFNSCWNYRSSVLKAFDACGLYLIDQINKPFCL